MGRGRGATGLTRWQLTQAVLAGATWTSLDYFVDHRLAPYGLIVGGTWLCASIVKNVRAR